jgi:uncharacterized membrane protein YhaH (DUF805 family)
LARLLFERPAAQLHWKILRLQAFPWRWARATFWQAVRTCLAKYVTFSGRATRAEYWWFTLFVTIAVLVAAFFDGAIFAGQDAPITVVVYLAVLLPVLAVSVRRLHDVGRSGWWLLIYFTGIGVFLLLYWFVQPSSPKSTYA